MGPNNGVRGQFIYMLPLENHQNWNFMWYLGFDRYLWIATIASIVIFNIRIITITSLLWTNSECMSPDCCLHCVNRRSSLQSKTVTQRLQPALKYWLCFLICFCWRASMTHSSLLPLFLDSVFSLLSPLCRLCSFQLYSSLSSLHNTLLGESFFCLNLSSAESLCSCKAAA